MSDMMRITGMATGMDTDTMVKKLIEIEQMKIDKKKQDKTYLEWQRDAYRDIIDKVSSFQSTYFDVLNPTTNFKSSALFAAYSESVTISGTASTVVSAEAGSGATPGTHTLNNITLAKNDIHKSSAAVAQGMEGTAVTGLPLKAGKSISVTIDGVAKDITLSADKATAADLATELSDRINDAFGIAGVVTESGGKLTFESAGHTISVSNYTHSYASDLGFTSGSLNSVTGSELDFSSPPLVQTGNIKIDINGAGATDVAIDVSANNIGELVTQLQSDIDAAIGANKVTVTNDGDKLKFVSYSTSDEIVFTSGDTDDVIAGLGISSGTTISKLEGTPSLTVSDIGKELSIFVDGTEYAVDLTADYATEGTLAAAIETQIAASGINVSTSGGKIVFTNTNGKEVKIQDSSNQIIDELGFTSGDSTALSMTDTLDQVFSGITDGSFTINGQSFSYDADVDSINDIINEVNASSAGVTLAYSELDDKFVLQSDDEGFANKITFSGDLLTSASRFNLNTNTQVGSDASFELDGVTTTRSTNEFSVDGVTYTLNSDYAEATDIKIGITSDTSSVIDTVKDFVTKYNELIGGINTEYSEKQYRDYRPLTEAQRKELSDEEIEKWEEKAKSGILKGESLLTRLTGEMRSALYESVSGVGLALYDIGITTSSSYKDNGKLVIDEDKLKEALEKNPDQVSDLFTKSSDYSYTDTANRSTRYSEQGLAHRLDDIMKDAIRTTRDDEGYKGYLLEKAGTKNDVSEFDNMIYDQIKEYDDEVSDLLDLLTRKETTYYNMFARLERAISEMNNQSAWLQGQLGG